MAWVFEPTPPTPLAPGSVAPAPFTAWLIVGQLGGVGVHVTANGVPKDTAQIEVDRRTPTRPTGPILDRIIGRNSIGDLMVLYGAGTLHLLFEATHAPMGLELLPGAESAVDVPQVSVTGLSLRDALTAFTTADPRYGWREMDGVVVVRPWTAWSDETHPLLQEVKEMRLERVSFSDVGRVVRSVLDPATTDGVGQSPLMDAHRFSVNVPRGSQLDLLNAIARAHGAVCWVFAELKDGDPWSSGCWRHDLMLYVAGHGGVGFPVP